MKYYYINKKRVSELEYFKQNFDEINPQSLNKKQLQKYQTVFTEFQKKEKRRETNAKISAKAKNRIRVNGRFISKEETQRINFFLEKSNLTFNQQNVNLAAAKTLFFTANNETMISRIFDHKGTVSIDGVTITKAEAVEKFEKANNLNRIEWAGRLNINPTDIYLLVYDLQFNPSTRNLNINTVITDEGKVVKSKKSKINESTTDSESGQ
jgi:hypothetical protein